MILQILQPRNLLLLLATNRVASFQQKILVETNTLFETSVSRRREMLSQMVGISLLPLVLPTVPVIAVESSSSAGSATSGILSTTSVAAILRPIPTFTIVDKNGVPFMVVGEDAKVTAYFFITFGEAKRLLNVAKTSANKAIARAKAEGQDPKEIGSNPWKEARISTVPLDSAVTLVTTLSSKSRGGGNYFRLAPSESDVEDALAISKQDDLAEGKVPIFYYADFTVAKDGTRKTPLYFRKSELEEDFRNANPGTDTPPVLVTELFSVLAEMVKPGGKDEDLKSLFFVAPRESEKKRNDCVKGGGGEPPFVVGQRIIVL